MRNMQNPVGMTGCKRVGKAMNFYRKQSNLSQQTVAGLLSVPYQTYKKYENGTDPIPGNRLSAFMEHLKIPPAEFEATLADLISPSQADVLNDIPEDTLSLVDRFATLNGNERKIVLDMVKTLLEKEMGIAGSR